MPAAGDRIERILAAVVAWAAARPDIEAVALVGSWARGTARPDSDVDRVLVVADPAIYETDDAWLADFGAVRRIEREDWGLVQSRRAFFDSGPEVEFGLTTRRWIAIDPVDAGTA